jgi:hypothetical protein
VKISHDRPSLPGHWPVPNWSCVVTASDSWRGDEEEETRELDVVDGCGGSA